MPDAEPTNEITTKATDSLVNMLSGMGGERDKRTQNSWARTQVSGPDSFNVQYETDWLSAAVVDTIPDDMLRERRTFNGLEPDENKAMNRAEDEFEVYDEISAALKWSRLYGGCGIIMLLDGTGEVWEPLHLSRVKKGSLKYLRTVDRWHLIPERVNLTQPLARDWAKPEFYRAFSGADRIHRSRILFFKGVKLPYRLEVQRQFWGGSILDRVSDAVMNAIATQNSIASLVHEAKVDALGIPNLFTMLSTAAGADRLKTRLETVMMTKSLFNTVIMDTNEEWSQKTSAIVPGLEPILQAFLTIASAAADVPVTRLIGTSAQGLNATGEGDLRNYYDSVASKRNKAPDPQLHQLDEVLLRHLFGQRPEEYSFEWPSLWQETETQKATNALTRSQTAKNYWEMDVLQPHHIAANLQESGEYEISDEEVDELKPLPPTPSEFE